MKCVFLVLVGAVCLGVTADDASQPKEYYTDEFDDFDVAELLSNERLFRYYLGCFRTGKNCNAQAKKARELIPDALKTECTHCTKTQLEKGRQIADFILKNHPEVFLEFEKKYDPNGTYRIKYEKRLKEEGIVLPERFGKNETEKL